MKKIRYGIRDVVGGSKLPSAVLIVSLGVCFQAGCQHPAAAQMRAVNTAQRTTAHVNWGEVMPTSGEPPTTAEAMRRRYDAVVRSVSGTAPVEPVTCHEDVAERVLRVFFEDEQHSASFRKDSGLLTHYCDYPLGFDTAQLWGHVRTDESPEGAAALPYIQIIRNVLEDKFHMRFDAEALHLEHIQITENENGHRIIRSSWGMVYYGYVHQQDGLGATIDFTDPNRVRLCRFGTWGPKIAPPPPIINISEEQARETARKTLTDWWTRKQEPPFELVPPRIAGPMRKQYWFRNDFYLTNSYVTTEESHLVYPVLIGVVAPLEPNGRRYNVIGTHGDYAVCVDCETGEVVGGGLMYRH